MNSSYNPSVEALPKMLLVNCRLVNEGRVMEADMHLARGRIEAIGQLSARADERVMDVAGRWVFPGLIDDQVHFRQPGLTHKADIASESRAAVAGGVTSYMEMPNVIPPTTTMSRLEDKRAIAAASSVANYAFYLGAAHDNLSDIASADPTRIAGIKIFMGASTGTLLVDDPLLLEKIFAAAPTLIATHCENTPRITARLQAAQARYGDAIPPAWHAHIRDHAACYESSSLAVALAKKTGARLHILHLTTAKELSLLAQGSNKQITSEACVHHLLFDERDYDTLGMRLKCNPAVKSPADRHALRQAVCDVRIDVVATDHAPHLLTEKEQPYERAAAGLPLIEYALPALLQLVAEGVLPVTTVAAAGAHRVADIFCVQDRGYLREGYFADLVIVAKARSIRQTLFSKCAWTPFSLPQLHYQVEATFVNGRPVFLHGQVIADAGGQALIFAR